MEDLLEDLEKDDILLCQLTNNLGIQKIFFNFLNFGDFGGPYLEDVISLYNESELGFEEFLRENSYSIVKSFLIKDNEQSELAENLRGDEEYISKYLFAMIWLITPQEFLENNMPMEAFKTSSGKVKLISYLTNLDDPSLLSHEKELLVLSKEIIEEHLGINPEINGIDHYPWENCTYQEVAVKIKENSLQFFTPFQLGVQAGERILGEEYFRNNKGNFWGLLETRTYMRAKHGLAKSLWELGKKSVAVKHMFDMLELNPNDNLGVRYLLFNNLFLVGEDEKLEKLFQQYSEDVGVFFTYNYALFLFKKYGDTLESQEAFKKAMQYNKHVHQYLLTTKKITESQSPSFSLGSKEEALNYALEAKIVWKKIPGSLKWLQMYLWN